MRVTMWQDLIKVFNKYHFIERKGLVLMGHNMVTIDVYRRWLELAGYIQKVGRGQYRSLKQIPLTTTVDSCRAYYHINRS